MQKDNNTQELLLPIVLHEGYISGMRPPEEYSRIAGEVAHIKSAELNKLILRLSRHYKDSKAFENVVVFESGEELATAIELLSGISKAIHELLENGIFSPSPHRDDEVYECYYGEKASEVRNAAEKFRLEDKNAGGAE